MAFEKASVAVALLLATGSMPVTQAYPQGAGSCNPGRLFDTVGHGLGSGAGDNGSLSDGGFTLEVGGVALDPSGSNTLLVGEQSSLVLTRDSGTFRGFLLRMEGKNGENAAGSFIPADSTLAQVMSGSELPTDVAVCPDMVAGLTHTLTFRGGLRIESENFIKPLVAGSFALDVTVVQSNSSPDPNVWYYETFDIEVVDAPSSAPSDMPSSSPSAVPSSSPSGVPSDTPSMSPSVSLAPTTKYAPSSVPSSGPTGVPTKAPTKAPVPGPTSAANSEHLTSMVTCASVLLSGLSWLLF